MELRYQCWEEAALLLRVKYDCVQISESNQTVKELCLLLSEVDFWLAVDALIYCLEVIKTPSRVKWDINKHFKR